MSDYYPVFRFPDDFKPEAQRVGNQWIGVYSVPWRHNHIVRDPATKQVLKFDSEMDAYKAATAVMCWQFRNKTRGWGDGIDTSNAEIEKVFGHGKKTRRLPRLK